MLECMAKTLKEGNIAIGKRKTMEVHPDMCCCVMEVEWFSYESVTVSLNHLLDNIAQGFNFDVMNMNHVTLINNQ